MDFSLWIGNSHTTKEIVRCGIRAEQTGWDRLWFADHVMPFQGDVDKPIHEAWAVLGALAASTERVRLGPLVCGNTYRNPVVLLKQAITTDHLSGGRVVLGLGSGWQENEHLAYGIEFGTFSDRFRKLEEALVVIRSLLETGAGAPHSDFAGEFYTLADAPLAPAPVGGLPILLGGGGEQKTLRMVAQYADEWNVWGTPEVLSAKGAILDEHCERLGRDPSTIRRTAVALLFLCDSEAEAAKIIDNGLARPSMVGTPEQLCETIAAYETAGVHEVIVPDFTLGDGQQKDEILDRFLAEVAAPTRA